MDYYLPGCPPEADKIWEAIAAIVEGKLPPPGSVLGVKTTVCDECKRTRNEKKIKKFYRTWEIVADEETCLLEQGLLCCGHRHAGRLRGPLPASQLALHRLPRRQRGRRRLRRTADERHRLGDRLQRPGGDRPHHPRGHSRSGGHVLPLQPGGEPAAAGEEAAP